MGIFQRYLSQSSPLVKMLLAISLTSALVVGHRTIYAPYVKKKRYQAAEEWANKIIDQEENMLESGDSQNNISY